MSGPGIPSRKGPGMGWREDRTNRQVLTEETLLPPPPTPVPPLVLHTKHGGGEERGLHTWGGKAKVFLTQPSLSLTPGELGRRGWSYLESFLPAGARPGHLRPSEDLQKEGVKSSSLALPPRGLLGL